MAHGRTMKAFNHAIDLLGLTEEKDAALHFLNEAVIHRDPNYFMRNFVHFVVEPKLRGRRKR